MKRSYQERNQQNRYYQYLKKREKGEKIVEAKIDQNKNLEAVGQIVETQVEELGP